MSKLPAQPINGLIDGFKVLQEIVIAHEPVSGSRLAEEMGLEVTRVNRLLKTLSYMGMVHRTSDRKYLPGAGIHLLAAQTVHGSGILQSALPELERLAVYDHTIALGVLWKEHVSYLYHREPHNSSFEAIGKLAMYPAEKSSIGRLLFTEIPRDEIVEIFKAANKPYVKFLKQVNDCRKNGYAILHRGDETSLAVKIGRPAYAAIAFSGKIAPTDLQKCIAILSEAAMAIENAMNLSKNAVQPNVNTIKL